MNAKTIDEHLGLAPGTFTKFIEKQAEELLEIELDRKRRAREYAERAAAKAAQHTEKFLADLRLKGLFGLVPRNHPSFWVKREKVNKEFSDKNGYNQKDRDALIAAAQFLTSAAIQDLTAGHYL